MNDIRRRLERLEERNRAPVHAHYKCSDGRGGYLWDECSLGDACPDKQPDPEPGEAEAA
jgi:hypothetical protein